jgi:hypothetical protein
MNQRRRSRLRSCRAESCAGALDATGGVTPPAPQARLQPACVGTMSVSDYSLTRVVHHRADLWRTAVDQLVHLVAERRFTPPRLVEVERDGYWWPGFQHAWRLCDDGRGWMAAIEYVAVYDWGRGKHLDCVPPGQVRLLVTPPKG